MTALLTALNDALETAGEVPCQSAPDLFFLESENPQSRVNFNLAKGLCATCPVRGLCLEYALDAGEEHGVWGGASPNDRRLIRRTRRGGHGRAGRPLQRDE